MLHILKLLIPALVPSWNFFDVITPSPRIQFALYGLNDEITIEWQEYRHRPTHLTLFQMIGRMLWNAKWNESMFIIGCAERLMVNPTLHSENEILNRMINDFTNKTSDIDLNNATHLQFRLLVVERQGSELHQNITYYSRIKKLPTWKIT